ncbi:MAG: hypothetical protein GY757_08635, partial [bacterium]|nr:hypothetical protein [bacterium]
MKKNHFLIVLLVSLILFPAAILQAQVVLNPNRLSKWKADKTYDIKWRDIGRRRDTIDIMLIHFKSGQKKMVKSGLKNNGTCSWMIH